MNYTISHFALIVLGYLYSEIDHIHLSSEAQCVTDPLKFKDTWYLWGKNSENMQLLGVLVCKADNGFPGKSAHPLHYYHIKGTSPIDCWYGP